jgi:hypothetical protein
MVSLLAALMEWVPLKRPVRVKGVEVLTGKETRRTYHIYMRICLKGVS